MNKPHTPEIAWVLSRGEYSDYRVLAVVNGTKKDAEYIAARANAEGTSSYYDKVEVEELPIVTRDVEKVEVLMMSVTIWDDGHTTDDRTSIRIEWPFDALFGTPDLRWRWVRAPIHNDKGGRLEVWGTDHDRVKKVFSDRIALIVSGDPLRQRREAEGKR